MTKTDEMDAACKRAWEGRLRVEKIIRREMYWRRRDKAIRENHEYHVWKQSDFMGDSDES